MIEDDQSDNVHAFGFLRGVRDTAFMLEIRHRDGKLSAFPYGLLDRAEFDPSDGLKLKFGSVTVRIIGRNLGAEARPNLRLFDGIIRRRVSWIQETDEATAMEAPKGAVVIEAVEVK
ncbi:MAG: hypothetical protein AB7I48_24750 [Planctomycetaceae bacterium]